MLAKCSANTKDFEMEIRIEKDAISLTGKGKVRELLECLSAEIGADFKQA